MTRETREELLATLLAERYGPLELILAEGGPGPRRSASRRTAAWEQDHEQDRAYVDPQYANGPARSRQEAPTRSTRLPVERYARHA